MRTRDPQCCVMSGRKARGRGERRRCRGRRARYAPGTYRSSTKRTVSKSRVDGKQLVAQTARGSKKIGATFRQARGENDTALFLRPRRIPLHTWKDPRERVLAILKQDDVVFTVLMLTFDSKGHGATRSMSELEGAITSKRSERRLQYSSG